MLTRLTHIDVAECGQAPSDRLSLWLGWADAIALATALGGEPPAVPPRARELDNAEERECARVRGTLTRAINDDTASGPARRHGQGRPPAQRVAPDAVPDYAVLRERYLSMQRLMETNIAQLRGRLRALLAARSPDMTRLALVDGVMERVLGARERALFASVPALLEGHFKRLRQAAQAPAGDEASGVDVSDVQASDAGTFASQPAAATPGAWLEVFRKDMRSVLLAELDFRFQPVEALLAALRSS